MKIKRLYLLGIGLMFTSQFLTSCHDLLEKDPTDSYSETVAWSSESSLDMYVTYYISLSMAYPTFLLYP